MPVVIIDTREQRPLVFPSLPHGRAGLVTGDYSFVGGEGLFAVERKSIQDLVGCCTGSNRERFERELQRLAAFHFRRLLVVGSEADILDHRYRSNVPPQSVLGSLAAWEVRYAVPVVFALDAATGAILVEKWIRYSYREILKNAQRAVKASAQ